MSTTHTLTPQAEFEALGYSSWINADIYPNGKIYTQEYTEWLEKNLLHLRKERGELLAVLKEMVELKQMKDRAYGAKPRRGGNVMIFRFLQMHDLKEYEERKVAVWQRIVDLVEGK